MRYAGPWSSPATACSLYIIAALLQVPDGLMAAYESQSEEEEMDEICGTLVQSRHCLQAIQAETRLNIQQHRAVSFLGSAYTVNTYSSFDILKQITSWDNRDLDPPFFLVLRILGGLYRIPDQNFSISALGSKRSWIWIRIKEFKHFLPKKLSECSSLIRTFFPFRFLDLGVKKAPDPGSGGRKTSFFRMKHLTCEKSPQIPYFFCPKKMHIFRGLHDVSLFRPKSSSRP